MVPDATSTRNMIDFNQPFKPFVLTQPMHIGQRALVFKVLALTPTGVLLTDPTCDEHPLLITRSDSDWVDWGDDFEMPKPLFEMLFGVEPEVGMLVVAPRA
jgi:hypothetical protein